MGVTTGGASAPHIDLMTGTDGPIHRHELAPENRRHCWFCGRDADAEFAPDETGPFFPFCAACREAFGSVRLPGNDFSSRTRP